MTTLLGLLLAAVLGTAHAQDSTTKAQAEAALEAAYQREIAYLVAEKRALDGRLSELQTQRRAEAAKADSRIAALQGRVLGLERNADTVENRLDALTDATLAATERAALLDSTVQQARDALGLEVADDVSEAQRLETIYATALTGLQDSATIQTRTQPFFLNDGTQVEGTVVQVGQVAVYGVSDTQAGPLLPLGGDRLMLRQDTAGADHAKALASGSRPDSLGMFLIESTAKPVSERTDRTVVETIEAGGIVAWVIVGLGVLAIALAGLRALLLQQAGRGQEAVSRVLTELRKGDLDAARSAVTDAKTATARVLSEVLAAGKPTDSDPREALQDVAAAAILEETPRIERFGALILVIAAVAPLLGLLGTVTGMIATFEIITEFGTGDPGMLSGGIGEALITTQLGLVVAIPAVLLGNILKGRQNEVLRRLDHAALQAVNLRCDDTIHVHPTDDAVESGAA